MGCKCNIYFIKNKNRLTHTKKNNMVCLENCTVLSENSMMNFRKKERGVQYDTALQYIYTECLNIILRSYTIDK